MNNKEAKDRLILLKMSYKIRIEEEDIEALDMGAEALENQKTGHWVFQRREGTERVYNCSNCGRKITRFDELVDFEKLFAYCPQCGAKLKGENNVSM